MKPLIWAHTFKSDTFPVTPSTSARSFSEDLTQSETSRDSSTKPLKHQSVASENERLLFRPQYYPYYQSLYSKKVLAFETFLFHEPPTQLGYIPAIMVRPLLLRGPCFDPYVLKFTFTSYDIESFCLHPFEVIWGLGSLGFRVERSKQSKRRLSTKPTRMYKPTCLKPRTFKRVALSHA